MRGLSNQFLTCLKSGFLSGIIENVRNDPDLDFEIREAYINIYYKGNALLKLTETTSFQYKAEINSKFLEGINLSLSFTESNITQFLNAIPSLKQNIVKYGKRSLEIEYEQLIIRANNFEPRNNTEYFIVDKQYVMNDARFDLVGIFWDRNYRRANQEVPICLMEVKFALNDDIKDVHNQLERYYEAIKPDTAKIASEMQTILHQKLALGLYQQTPQRLNALKTLSFSTDINQIQFILILVDYNPYSSKLDLQSLAKLPFANQIKVFRSGFAMWQQNIKSLSSYLQ